MGSTDRDVLCVVRWRLCVRRVRPSNASSSWTITGPTKPGCRRVRSCSLSRVADRVVVLDCAASKQQAGYTHTYSEVEQLGRANLSSYRDQNPSYVLFVCSRVSSPSHNRFPNVRTPSNFEAVKA